MNNELNRSGVKSVGFTQKMMRAGDTFEQAAWQAREEIMPGRDAQDGDCQPVSERLVEILKEKGYADAFAVFDQYEGHPHVWVRVQNWTIDPTHDQFALVAPEDKEDFYLDNPILIRKTAAV